MVRGAANVNQLCDITRQPPRPPKKRGRRLYNLQNVRTLLADVLRQVEADDPADLDPGQRVARARVLIYGGMAVAELIKGTDLEQRLSALERA
jgi:hypothetical protein